jgi:hypothetical protein
MQTQRPQINVPNESVLQTTLTIPLITPPPFIPPPPKRKVYVDAEEMSWYIEQISLSMASHKKMTRSDSVWPIAFAYKV